MLVLTRPFGVNGVWYSLPVADILAFAAAAVMAVYEMKLLRNMEGKKNDEKSGLYFKEQPDL